MATQSAARRADPTAEAFAQEILGLEAAAPLAQPGRPGRMDAAARVQALEQELTRAPLGTTSKEKARARLLGRLWLCLAGAGLAVVIGGLAGTLSTL